MTRGKRSANVRLVEGVFARLRRLALRSGLVDAAEASGSSVLRKAAYRIRRRRVGDVLREAEKKGAR